MTLYLKVLYVKVLAFLLSVAERRRGMADTRVIADVEHRLGAWQTGNRLVVYRSVIVNTDGPVYAPVRELLASTGAELESSIKIEDEMMMFGEAELSVYAIQK